MLRIAFIALLLIPGFWGCAEPAEAPAVTELEDPAIEEATEEMADPEPEDAVAFAFNVDGEAGPAASYALDEGRECLVYSTHIVRLSPVDDGDGHTIELVSRSEGASPFDLCSADGEVDLPTRAGVDTFVALEDSVLWTRRDSRGRDLLTGYNLATEEEVFSETVTPPVAKDDEGLTYGGPLESMASLDALEAAGVTCPEAEAWFTDGREVAISRRLRYSFETSTISDAGEALCVPTDDA